ncbi:MAG: SulP family inorganic anion transporter [Bifidobacteriaceae bacterium]|nr:SulP family inorganic anion transporter [Bifidobacteriaceae bacterium]
MSNESPRSRRHHLARQRLPWLTSALNSVQALLPATDDYRPVRRTWRLDITAGITVGIVALPLALAFGASAFGSVEGGPEAGLITAIVAGLVAAVFGGSNVQVSGPTGAMVVVLAPILATRGASVLGLLTVMAGFMVLLAGVFRLGRTVSAIPWPVIEGFTHGIAIIIFCQQIPAALGVEADHLSRNAAIAAVQSAGLARWPDAWWPLLAAAGVAAFMFGGARLNKKVPWSLVGLVVVSGVWTLAHLPGEVIGKLPTGLPKPSLPTVSWELIQELSPAAATVAVLAAIESLLSARVAAQHSDTGRLDPDRELVGQGLASMATGLFHGMPATGAIARTAVNTSNGAKTRLAAIVHSLVLLGIVSFTWTIDLVSTIPLAALAGVLMVTAVRMVPFATSRTLLTLTRQDATLFVLTALITVSVDLIYAVGIGIVAAAFFALRAMSRAAGLRRLELPGPARAGDERIAFYRIDGSLFFAAAERLLAKVGTKDVSVVILSLSSIQIMDSTGAQVLGELVVSLERQGLTVLIEGIRPEHLALARGGGVTKAVRHAKHVFTEVAPAVEHARSHIGRETP